MQSLKLEQASEFLNMNPEVLRRKAKAGVIPGKKPGKRWIFIHEHLVDGSVDGILKPGCICE